MSLSGARVAMALLLVTALVAAPYRADAITCVDVYTPLYPCLAYVQGSVKTVPDACCSGLRSVVAEAKTKTDRQTACNCLKSGAARITKKELALASGVPAECRVNFPYKISPSIDCSKVN